MPIQTCTCDDVVWGYKNVTMLKLFRGAIRWIGKLHFCFFIVARILSTSAMCLSVNFWNCGIHKSAILVRRLTQRQRGQRNARTSSSSAEYFPIFPFFTLAWWCLRSWTRVFSASRWATICKLFLASTVGLVVGVNVNDGGFIHYFRPLTLELVSGWYVRPRAEEPHQESWLHTKRFRHVEVTTNHHRSGGGSYRTKPNRSPNPRRP